MWTNICSIAAETLFFAAAAITALYYSECLILDMSLLSIPGTRISTMVYLVVLAYLVTSLSPVPFFIRVGGAVVLALVLYLAARFLGMGGGDVIAIPVIALMWGLPAACAIIAIGCIGTTVFILLRCLVKRKRIHKGDEFPLMPGISIVYLIYEAFTISTNYL